MASRKPSLVEGSPHSQSGRGSRPFRLITLTEQAAVWREEWPRLQEQYEMVRETAREIRAKTKRTRQRAEGLREEAKRLGKRDRRASVASPTDDRGSSG